MLTTTVCAALSAAGLAVALLTAFRRRFVAALRIAALSLLPVGLAMAGLIGLGAEIGTAVGSWASDLVFKPTVWAGFSVLAVAVVLYVIARLAGGRRSGRTARKERAAAQQKPAAPAASAPALGKPGASRTPAEPASGGKDQDDFSDVEAILKKHGI